MSQLFTAQAKRRAEERGVADQVKFIHGDAAGYVSDEKASVAACVGATWIAGGVVGTIELLARSLRTGGIILIGEPYWRQATAGEYYVGLTSDPAHRLRVQRRPATPHGTPPTMADARVHRVNSPPCCSSRI